MRSAHTRATNDRVPQMIEYLRVERWKAYQHLEISLEPGTTFLVARNGLGKTSLVEAAAFAVTGVIGPGPVVRAGSQDAEVEAQIRLPDGSLLAVTRQLDLKGRKPEISSFATVDGAAVPDMRVLLENAWKAPLPFVARCAFVHQSLHATQVEGIRDQLARAFGVAELQNTLRTLDAAHEELTKRTTSEDRGLREENADRDQLATNSNEAQAALAKALSAKDVAKDLLNAAEVSERKALVARQEAEGRLAWTTKRGALLRDVIALTGHEVQPAELSSTIGLLDRQAQDELTSIRAEITAIRTRISIVEAAADELSSAGATCPVCRRPLDDQAHAAAAAAHRSEIGELRATLATMSEEDFVSRTSLIRRLADRLVALGPEPEEEEVALEAAGVETDSETARAKWQAAVEVAAVAQAEFDRARARLAELDADRRRLKELQRLYRELALVEASRTAVESTVRRVLLERVEPLLSVVRRRWKTLFPDRPNLQLDVDGNFSRTVGDVNLPFGAFSTGERAAAQLLLRLVLVEATTRTGMCWVDEPLEHLDPTSRRLVGGMLAQPGTASGRRTLNLRQIFVTTYEEPLARRIADTIEDAHIVYVTASLPE